MVRRIFVEKKPVFAGLAQSTLKDIQDNLKIDGLRGVRIFHRYDVMGISDDVFTQSKDTIFSEPMVDLTYEELPEIEGSYFAIEYLPGQYDQRADSCEQCIGLLTEGERPIVRSATVYGLIGRVSEEELAQIKAYFINPVESREATLLPYATLEQSFEEPDTVAVVDGFIDLDHAGLAAFIEEYGLAMDENDISVLQDYFKNEEGRNPTITEIRMVDTYWSDHCRHTTFLTQIEDVSIRPDYIEQAYQNYLDSRDYVYRGKEKPVCLMDLATIAAKQLKKEGRLPDLDESEEINACSVKIRVDVDGEEQDWLLMFKNETHNHPTEIEPFGGAATCLGGAIRDPLSGRVYVYQAMRITGSGDPRSPKTLEGKLPQRKITVGAAQGYSSYGNQIGLATGLVKELYHPGYVAKRMEIGAVIGAAPQENVRRERPEAGDIVLLIGGKTGRDGCGGATGSSKAHTQESIHTAGAEVQKGNPPEERKIQRLFRNPAATRLIKRCNDFGAGGVSVAIGELADGLDINLDAVPKKYAGLDGTELAISESQERMAVVVAADDAIRMIALASAENLQATPVAMVTDTNRLTMQWKGNTIVDISRDFLNTNGASKHTRVRVKEREIPLFEDGRQPTKENWLNAVRDLNVCSQKGLVERFDSTIGQNTVLMPFGGKNQLTPGQSMVAKIPMLGHKTTTTSMMAYGFDPYLSEQSPFHGAMYAVVESAAKLVATGGDLDRMWLTFQEYFPKTGDDPEKWGLPFEALLGAIESQRGLGLGAIGGKDSMSGTFEHLNVPPTLVSFAVSVGSTQQVVSPELKQVGSNVFLLKPKVDQNNLIDFKYLNEMYRYVSRLIGKGKVRAAYALGRGGLCQALTEMTVGNDIGIQLAGVDVFSACYGGLVIETEQAELDFGQLIGRTIDRPEISIAGESISLEELKAAWREPLEKVFPEKVDAQNGAAQVVHCDRRPSGKANISIARPRVVIPVFPGTNCEYDTANAFARAGAVPEIVVLRNLNEEMIRDSVNRMKAAIDNAQIIMIPGGFSGGDEPEGSGKFISVFFRNPAIQEAVMHLLGERDGLMLGVCNGFQALIKLGLVPFGEIRAMDADCPTLTFNQIGRHQSKLVRTRIASVHSPWLSQVNVGDIHTIPVSHGEGRFVANEQVMQSLIENGQIATQYVDEAGNPSMDIAHNPNGSMNAVEGILSADGRVFGKMGHSERIGEGVYQNVPGTFDQKIFESGVAYFQ